MLFGLLSCVKMAEQKVTVPGYETAEGGGAEGHVDLQVTVHS